jgi:hypothetical protein
MRDRRRLLDEKEWVSLKSNWKITRIFVLRVYLFCKCGKVIQYIVRSFVCGYEILLISVVCVRMAVIILIEALWLRVCVCEMFCLDLCLSFCVVLFVFVVRIRGCNPYSGFAIMSLCLWYFCRYLCDSDCNPYPKCFHES